MYKIADFNFDLSFQHYYSKRFAKEYITSGQDADAVFCCKDEDFKFEEEKAGSSHYFGCVEYVAYCRKVADFIPNHGAFVLHSATFDVGGVGVAFAAHSGTGKTTHMRLWQKYLGDKMVIVNGDKPIVRFFEDEPEQPYAYGTPWNGKEHLGCNMRTPLKHICFIERSETNYVEAVDKKDAVDRIFNQVYMPKDPMAVMNTMQLIDRLLSCCKLWTIHCNMEPQAAEIAYKTIFEAGI